MGWYGPSVDVSVCYFVALPRLEHSVGVGMLHFIVPIQQVVTLLVTLPLVAFSASL